MVPVPPRAVNPRSPDPRPSGERVSYWPPGRGKDVGGVVDVTDSCSHLCAGETLQIDAAERRRSAASFDESGDEKANVVLPDPLGPLIATTSPFPHVESTRSRTARLSRQMERSSAPRRSRFERRWFSRVAHCHVVQPGRQGAGAQLDHLNSQERTRRSAHEF